MEWLIKPLAGFWCWLFWWRQRSTSIIDLNRGVDYKILDNNTRICRRHRDFNDKWDDDDDWPEARPGRRSRKDLPLSR